jgi:4-hydroxythreonine-4-phosphate dehydrogenase
MPLPRIGITAGDPSGIGPEIARKAMADQRVLSVCEPLYYGPQASFTPGVLSADAGRAAHDTIVRAVRDAQSGGIQGMATAPIHKEAFALAGLPWRGHTEMLAELTRTEKVAMMFWSDKLRVVLLTIHIPLASVPAALTIESVSGIIELTHRELPRFGIARPRLALAGLNPHAGEHGILGRDEMDVLEPAVARSVKAGVDIRGPFPGDTVFVRAMRGEFDVVIACYHDQGLIPVKMAAFGQAVNVTLGLPIIRTSVDHGTAFDIAGKDIADPESMVQAVLLAAKLAGRSAGLPLSREASADHRNVGEGGQVGR